MAKTDLKLYANDGYGEKTTTSISYINPDAGKNDILDFTYALNSLTTNTYVETDKITTVNVDLETVPSTPTLSASKTQYSLSEFTGTSTKNGPVSTLTYNGDGGLFVDKAAIDAGLSFILDKPATDYYLTPRYSTAPTVPFTFTVGFTETANYKACSVDITITA